MRSPAAALFRSIYMDVLFFPYALSVKYAVLPKGENGWKFNILLCLQRLVTAFNVCEHVLSLPQHCKMPICQQAGLEATVGMVYD